MVEERGKVTVDKHDDSVSRGLCLIFAVVFSGASWWFYYHDDVMKAIFWAFLGFEMNPNPAIVSGLRHVLRQLKQEK